ncbi:hypothetical protein NL676_020143 [Syzygium grande]|nr:hypothetical protein NL676_020143 [Syzygium grande]
MLSRVLQSSPSFSPRCWRSCAGGGRPRQRAARSLILSVVLAAAAGIAELAAVGADEEPSPGSLVEWVGDPLRPGEALH